jgi:hypothetical protein
MKGAKSDSFSYFPYLLHTLRLSTDCLDRARNSFAVSQVMYGFLYCREILILLLAIIVLKNQIRRQVTEQGLNPNTPEAIQGSSLGTRTTPESSTSTRFSQEVFNGPFENGTVPALPVVGDQNDQTSYLNDFFLLDHPWDWLVSDGIVHDEYLWDGEPR